MSNPIIRIHDTASDEVIDREMNDAEYAEHQAQQTQDAAMTEAAEQAATDKAALLAKLGITADEAKLLLS